MTSDTHYKYAYDAHINSSFIASYAYLMCYKVVCSKCNKATWKGCGLHIDSALSGLLFLVI